MQETPVPGLGRSPGEGNGNPLQYSYLENPMDRGAWQTTVHEVARVGHDLATKEREREPNPVLLPGKFHRQRSLVGYIPRGFKESDMTE